MADGPPGVEAVPGIGAGVICGVEPGMGLLPGRAISGDTPSPGLEPSLLPAFLACSPLVFLPGVVFPVPEVGWPVEELGGGGGSMAPFGAFVAPRTAGSVAAPGSPGFCCCDEYVGLML
jgi:hypothetical protein